MQYLKLVLKQLKWGDAVSVAAVLLLIFFIANNKNNSLIRNHNVEVKVDGNIILTKSLDSAGKFSVEGYVGTTEFEIVDNSVRILSAPCPGKHCIKQGKISKSGQSIICVPNHLIISIKGNETGNIDAVTK